MMTIPDGYPADSAGAFAVLRSRSTLGADDLKVLAMIESRHSERDAEVIRYLTG